MHFTAHTRLCQRARRLRDIPAAAIIRSDHQRHYAAGSKGFRRFNALAQTRGEIGAIADHPQTDIFRFKFFLFVLEIGGEQRHHGAHFERRALPIF
jgi:hypothetical protein